MYFRSQFVQLAHRSVAAFFVPVATALAGVPVTPSSGTIEWTNKAGWSTGHVPGGGETPQISTGTVTVTGVPSVDNINFFGGAITNPTSGNGTLIITRTGSEWSAGTLNSSTGGNLSFTVGLSADLLISTGNYHDFDATAIVNNGTVNWTAGDLRSGNSGSFVNQTTGVFNDTASGNINNVYGGTNTSSFTNNGIYNKAASGTTTFSVPFANSGTLNIALGTLVFGSTFASTGGAINFSGNATAQFPSPLSLGTTALTGAGTVTASAVTTGGLVSPGNSLGRLNITGNLTLLSTSVLLFELGGTASGTFDVLTVSNTAALGGTLHLAFANGFASAVLPANTFSLITAATISGAFANEPLTGPWILATDDGLGSFQVNISSTALTLSNFVAAIPEPSSTWTLILVGLATVIISARRRFRPGI